ncbi:MAG TPA: tRNA (adenosine(37)-N6)-threonylcarbamoyltransferase complex dimerization subunit type 1 TsaB [Candidatus Limnocylindrales bacterium]|nr:tRNA (adenosine(37)-N6)-threonylcarbamoyltransferase complex dimerization subunit type 1 TsaB [Candidatus Limnocylindrales bacterium]
MSTAVQLLLAIDTSGAEAGLVLADVGTGLSVDPAVAGGAGIDVAMLPADRGFSRTEDLASHASSLLARRGCGPQDLAAVAAVVGPGSYTGLRSGLAFLRGLAFSESLPAVSVGALELLAWRAARPGETVIAVWPAGKGRSLVGVYRCGDNEIDEIVEPETIDDGEVPGRVVSLRDRGTIAVIPSSAVGLAPSSWSASADLAAVAHAAGIELRVPAPESFARLAVLAASRLRAGKVTTTGALLPVYVGLAAIRPAPNVRNVSMTRE